MYKPDEAGKVFVGGLNWETTEDNLRTYFMKYGEVTDCVIMKQTRPDNTTTSRGFGFVTFKDPDNVKTVIQSEPHYLDGKKIDPKPAVPKGPGQQAILSMQKPSSGNLKVFLGGIGPGTSETDIKEYFSVFGKVCDVTLMYDKATNRMRGFGFVGFESQASVDQVINAKYHQINGKTVEVKPAEPQNRGGGGGMKGQGMPHGATQAQYGAQYGQPSAHMYAQQPPRAAPFGQMGYGAYGGQQPQAPAPGSAPGGYGYGYGMATASPGYENGFQQAGAAAASRDAYGGMAPQAATASPYGDLTYGRGAPGPVAPQRDAAAAAAGAPTYGGYGSGFATSSMTTSYPEFGQSTSSPPLSAAQQPGSNAPPYSTFAGLGSYQQEASQFGPSRSTYPETTYGQYTSDPYAGYPTAGAGDAANPVTGFGRGGNASASRGYHPYGR